MLGPEPGGGHERRDFIAGLGGAMAVGPLAASLLGTAVLVA